MRSIVRATAFLATFAIASSAAFAELKPGVTAPLFETQASLGGKVFNFDLKKALAEGPVVLYFYPAAFTKGCTIEAHDFADHIDEYHKLGATVIGVSGDDIAKLNDFSVSECRSKFAVASDANHHISTEYDAVITKSENVYSNRTSYVIAQDGTIVYAYASLDPSEHVANTLAALHKLVGR